MTARLEAAEQYFFGQRLLDVLLDHPRDRPGAHLLVIAARDQPFRLLELFPQNYHEPYYMSYTNEDFSALPIK
jgi:hypothetical protein